MAGYGRRNVTYALVAAVVVALTVGVWAVPTAPAAPSGWTIVTGASSGAGNSDLLLGTTCANAWSCWAVGGTFPNLNNGQPSTLINHWDGNAWSVTPLAPPAGSTASLLWNATCVTTSDCWAVGGQQLGMNAPPSTLAEHWDGSGWTVVPTPVGFGYLFSVACTETADCWAAGTSVAADNSGPLNGIVDHWDGTSWSPVATAPSGQTYDQFNSVACSGASDCWAVGFAGPNRQQNNFLPNVAPNLAGDGAFAERWDGTSWSVASVPQAIAPLGTYLSAVTCTSASQCWAVGATMDAAGDPSATLVDRWDGSTWITTPSPSPSPSSGFLTGVTCLDASTCWASGAYGFASGQSGGPSPFIEGWSGTQWSIEPSPNVTAFGYLDGLACVRGALCQASGFAITNLNNNTTVGTLVEQLQLPAAGNQGIWMSAADGGVFAFGDARFAGSMGGVHLNAPMVGMAPTPDGRGYWLVASDGGVFSFGDARFAGSTGALRLNRPMVGMAPTPDGRGYWLVASDGGVFTFGDATYWGSVPGQGIAGQAPVVGMAPTPDGGGYWLVDQAGAVYAYGDAAFLGAMTGLRLSGPVTGVAARS